jgi:hypothetical protein
VVQGARLADVMHDSCERSADDAADSFVLSVPPSGIGDKCTLRKKLSVVIAMIPFFISFSGSIVCHLFAHGCVASAHFHILLAFLKLVFYNTFLKLLLLHFTFSNLCIVFFFRTGWMVVIAMIPFFYFLFRINCLSFICSRKCGICPLLYFAGLFETGFLQHLFEIVIAALYAFKSLYSFF